LIDLDDRRIAHAGSWNCRRWWPRWRQRSPEAVIQRQFSRGDSFPWQSFSTETSKLHAKQRKPHIRHLFGLS